MITKFEKSKIEMKEGIEEKSFDSVETKAEADYIHYCGHDTNPPKPCRRVKI